MDINALHHQLEVDAWSEKKCQLTKELDKLQNKMIADTSISVWGSKNTARCDELVESINFAQSRLTALQADEIVEVSPDVAKAGGKFGAANNSKPDQRELSAAETSEAMDDTQKTPRRSGRQAQQKRKFDEAAGVNGAYEAKKTALNSPSKSSKRQKNTVPIIDGAVGEAKQASDPAVQKTLDGFEGKLRDYKTESNAYLASLPLSEKDRDSQYYKLVRAIYYDILLQLDAVKAAGEDRTRRRGIVHDAQGTMRKLDATMPPEKKWEP